VAVFNGIPLRVNTPVGEVVSPVVRIRGRSESPTKMSARLWSKRRVTGTSMAPEFRSYPPFPPDFLVTVMLLGPSGVLMGPTKIAGNTRRSIAVRSPLNTGEKVRLWKNGPGNRESAIRIVAIPVNVVISSAINAS
jgi:hypothetical protein